MVSKVFDGHSFYHACRYVYNKPGAVVLESEGVRGHDPKLMADDFTLQAELRPSKKQACFHSVLSFYPGESPSHSTMLEIAQKYLKGIGILNTQFAIALHTDKAHLHLHIISNMVNNEGKAISDSWIGYKAKKVAQRLTTEYNLIPAEKKQLEHINLEALSQSEANRYKIYQVILTSIPYCRTMDDLEKCLLAQDIIVQYKYKGQSLEKQGISFQLGADCFKGSKVDRSFSLRNLEKTLELQKNKSQKPEQEKRDTSNKPQSLHQQIISSDVTPTERNVNPEISNGLLDIISLLLQPVEVYVELPYELKLGRRKKKKRRRRRH